MVSIDSIGSLRRSLFALKVTIQIGKVGESIWQYSQFVSRRAQCYQAYIYTHDTNPRELWARYQRPTDFSFNWVFFQRSPLFGGNIGSKTGFLLGPRRESNSTTPNPSYLQREWRADISLVNQRFIYIYVFLFFFFFFFGVSSLRKDVDPLPFCHLFAGKMWKSYRSMSRWNRGGLKRKLEQMFELFALKFDHLSLRFDGEACGLIDSIKFNRLVVIWILTGLS